MNKLQRIYLVLVVVSLFIFALIYLASPAISGYNIIKKVFGSTEISEKTNFIKLCKNKVSFKNKIAIWTMLTNSSIKYSIGALKLLKSIHSNINPKITKFDTFAIELTHKPLGHNLTDNLTQAG